MKTLTGIPVCREGLTVRAIEEEIIILVEEEDQIHNLEGTAAFLWNLIDGRRNGEELLQSLLTTYTVEETTARRDVLEFLESCSTKGLISIRET